MKSWPIQEAKNQVSRLVELAETASPQTVTRHGEPMAVLLSVREYKRIGQRKESVLEFFRPLQGSGIRLDRNRAP